MGAPISNTDKNGRLGKIPALSARAVGVSFASAFLLVAGEVSADRGQVDERCADLAVYGGTVLTMDDRMRVIHDGVVVITDGIIVDLGEERLLEEFCPKEVMDAKGGIVMPGFVNTHTHLAMTVFRTLGEDVTDRLHRYLFPLEERFADLEMVRIGTRLGVLESIKGGTTTLVDMYYFEDEVAKIIDQAGLRAVVGQTIMSKRTPDAQEPAEAIDRTITLIKDYANHPRITPAFAPHGPYTNSEETLKEIAKLSERYGALVTMHVAESQRESDAMRARGAETSVEYLASIGMLSSRLLMAHAIRVKPSDIELLKKYDVRVGHCVSANIKSAKGVAPIPALIAAGVTVGLCTDGPMSGNGLSIIDELSQVGKTHKLHLSDRGAMPVQQIVALATRGGARAVGMEQEIGSLQIGMQADIIVVETSTPNMTPIYDNYAALVYSALASNVRHTIVDGRPIMKDRQVLTMDEEAILQDARELAARIMKTDWSIDRSTGPNK